MDFYLLIVILIGFLVCEADSNTICGCLVDAENWESNCSNQTSADFKCLSESKLNILILQNNKYGYPPRELLQHDFSNLTYIDLSYNKITETPDDWVTHFPRLSTINLNYNQLAHAPELVRKYPNIDIRVKGNKFICDCKYLKETLDITNEGGQVIMCTNKELTKPTSYYEYCSKRNLQSDNTDNYYWVVGFIIIIILIFIFLVKRFCRKY